MDTGEQTTACWYYALLHYTNDSVKIQYDMLHQVKHPADAYKW